MEPITAALLTDHRDVHDDLAFSALPHAPRRDDSPGPLRRSLSRGLVRTARRLEPGLEVAPATTLPSRRHLTT